MFHVHADFSRLPALDRESDTAVEFARQGVKITCGSVQRYIPIPTDGEIHRATVTKAGGLVRVAVPTAGLANRGDPLLCGKSHRYCCSRRFLPADLLVPESHRLEFPTHLR